MEIRLHPHAIARLLERAATRSEIIETVRTGESFPAKYGRVGFRKNFRFEKVWKGKSYSTKQIETYAVEENGL